MFNESNKSLLDTGAVIVANIFATENDADRFNRNEATAHAASVKLLIDTGSNISGLDKKIIRILQLVPYPSSELVDGVGGLQVVTRYQSYLQLPSFVNKLMMIDLLEGDFNYSPYDGVIGRDVLQYFHFEYDGLNNQFRLSLKGRQSSM